ncbi:MAG: acylglycerol kinase family protein [Acidimicrobiia bacterium]|nr:acylglycerol kinase family protein [Acidimicrobiia bacterium]
MRLLLIVNATASSVTARRRVVIRKALSADHQVELVETSRRGHATRLARSAALEGFDCVVVLAGDGTLNEAADGLAGSATALAPSPEAPRTSSPGPSACPAMPSRRRVSSCPRSSGARSGESGWAR